MRFHKIRLSCLHPLLFLLCSSGFFAYAAEFGTSDIYTASIVAARNNVPVLLYRDAQCTLCSKIEDFLVGLGTQYQTVRRPFVCPCKLGLQCYLRECLVILVFGGINSHLTVLCWDLKQDGSAIVAGEERLLLPSTMFASHAPCFLL
jgi:hypothetical protein